MFPRRLQQVLSLRIAGLSEKEIARELKISRHTAHDYLKEIMRRLGVQSQGELAEMMFRTPRLRRLLIDRRNDLCARIPRRKVEDVVRQIESVMLDDQRKRYRSIGIKVKRIQIGRTDPKILASHYQQTTSRD